MSILHILLFHFSHEELKLRELKRFTQNHILSPEFVLRTAINPASLIVELFEYIE